MRRLATIGCAVALSAWPSKADVAPPRIRGAPLELTLVAQSLPDAKALVVLGCNSIEGRHALAFPELNQVLRCSLKQSADVYLADAALIMPLRALVQKDVGWGQEWSDAQSLLDKKAIKCGTVRESARVGITLGPQTVMERYRVDAGAGGCSLTRLEPSDAGSIAPAASASSVVDSPRPAPTASARDTAQPSVSAKSGCAGCTTRPRGSGPGIAWLMAGFAVSRLRRRRL